LLTTGFGAVVHKHLTFEQRCLILIGKLLSAGFHMRKSYWNYCVWGI